MAEDIRFPTWKDVGVPEALATAIKAIRQDSLLEQLIFEKVFHNQRRLQYVYVCGVCGHQHKAEKSIEDYGSCEKCKSRAIRATQHLRGWNREHPPGCSQNEDFARTVMLKMRQNYAAYFNRTIEDFPPDEVIVFRWRENGLIANYMSGDRAEDKTSAKTLCRASLLVPFLWDSRFDWKNKKFRASGRQAAIMPTLFEMVQKGGFRG